MPERAILHKSYLTSSLLLCITQHTVHTNISIALDILSTNLRATVAIHQKISTFAPKELKREPEGGLSFSAKSCHLPLRKQFNHDSPGKSISSLNEAALFINDTCYGRDTILHLCVITAFLSDGQSYQTYPRT